MSPINSKNFPEASFPVSYRSDFRVHFDPDVYAQIKEHVQADTSHEVGGILVGLWQKDENGPYATVTAIIRCDKAVGKEGEVTFTHETWNDIAREMDGPYVDLQIVGWYHSHPGFGVFLSERDLFIQEHFFSNPGQIALVIDPLNETEGVFLWKEDNIVPGELFWVGQKIILSQEDNAKANQHPKVKIGQYAHEESGRIGAGGSGPIGENTSIPFGGSWFSLLVILTLCMGMFVLGGILKPTDEFDYHQRIIEGTLYDYCFATGKRPGLEHFLLKIEQDLRQAIAEVKKLEKGEVASNKKEGDAKEKLDPIAPERLAALTASLKKSQEQLIDTYSLYCLSEKEKLALIKLIGLNLQSTIKTKPDPVKKTETNQKTDSKPQPKQDPPKTKSEEKPTTTNNAVEEKSPQNENQNEKTSS